MELLHPLYDVPVPHHCHVMPFKPQNCKVASVISLLAILGFNFHWVGPHHLDVPGLFHLPLHLDSHDLQRADDLRTQLLDPFISPESNCDISNPDLSQRWPLLLAQPHLLYPHCLSMLPDPEPSISFRFLQWAPDQLWSLSVPISGCLSICDPYLPGLGCRVLHDTLYGLMCGGLYQVLEEAREAQGALESDDQRVEICREWKKAVSVDWHCGRRI